MSKPFFLKSPVGKKKNNPDILIKLISQFSNIEILLDNFQEDS